jgi:DNA gyrase inhibitor GyrI
MIRLNKKLRKGAVEMNKLDVRIVELAPMRVVKTYGFGQQPEDEAWTKLRDWMQANGMLGEIDRHRYFGFNNPSPTPASPNYGYEQWMTVDAGVEAGEGVEIKQVPGGLYAVAQCTLDEIGEVWQQLASWREDSEYKPGNHQWLEEALSPELTLAPAGPGEMDISQFRLDLYLPIRK